ncbi:MAG: hypothetical protein CMO58_04740 [Verrucomicrobiales bacterium]|nr:hypothetical protein [Verrucomicrobiales bacterium]
MADRVGRCQLERASEARMKGCLNILCNVDPAVRKAGIEQPETLHHMLVAVAVVYAVALLWLAIKPEPPNQQNIVLTLGGFNLIYLGVANRLAKRLAT